MRLALFLVIAASAGLIAIFIFAPDDGLGPKDLERQPDAVPRTRGEGAAGFDVTALTGEAVFTSLEDFVQLGNERLPYPVLLFQADQTRPEAGSSYVLEGVRVLWNPEPRTNEEFERITRVPAGTKSGAIANLLDEAIGAQAPGLSAARCRFLGGRDLASARAVRFEGPVVLELIDPADRRRKARLETGALEGTIENRRLVRLATDDEVIFRGEEGVLRGTGLDVDVDAGTFVLERRISGELKGLDLLGRTSGPGATAPLEFEGGGPLHYTPHDPAQDRAARTLFGSFRLEGGFHATRGARSLRGESLFVHRSIEGPISEVHISGPLVARSEFGTITGQTGRWLAHGAEGRGELRIEDGLTTLTLAGGGSWLPLSSVGEDLVLSSESPLRWIGLADVSERRQFLEVGPNLRITSGALGVEAEHLRVELARIARVHAAPSLEPVEMRLTGSVRGEAPDGRFQAEELHALRRWLDDGTPDRQALTLKGAPLLVLEAVALGPDGATPSDRLVGNLLGQEGALMVAARQQLSLERDPLRRKPLRLTAVEDVRLRRSDASGAERISLDTGLLKLSIASLRSINDAGEAKVVRRLVEARAENGVRLKTLEGADLAGHELVYNATDSHLLLTGDNELATLARSPQERARARRIALDLARQLLIAEGQAFVEAPLDALPLEALFGQAARTVGVPERTTLRAEKVTLGLLPEDPELARTEPLTVRWTPKSIAASDPKEVVLEQGRSLRIVARDLDFDLAGRTGQLRGTPATLDIVRQEGIVDHLATTEAAISGEEALLAGPVEGTVHVERSRIALDLGAFAGPDHQLVPLRFTARDDTYLSRERASLRGAVALRLGPPELEDPTRLDAERVFLLFAPDGPIDPSLGSGSSTIYRVVAEGAVDFHSAELSGLGDVMELDAYRRILTLTRENGDAELRREGAGAWRYPSFLVDFTDRENITVRWSRRQLR